MTNVKTDKRYLDIKAKISKLEKNVSDIKETISQKAAELKQLAKSKKEFKVSRTLGDLTHQLFQKQEKTLKEKAETLTHETHDLESDLKSALKAIQIMEQKKEPLLEELKIEAINKNNESISLLQKEFEEIFSGFFPKIENLIQLVIDNVKLREGRDYFLVSENFVFQSWIPYALYYIKQLTTKGYDFEIDERVSSDLGIDDLRHNQFFYRASLYSGRVLRDTSESGGFGGSLGNSDLVIDGPNKILAKGSEDHEFAEGENNISQIINNIVERDLESAKSEGPLNNSITSEFSMYSESNNSLSPEAAIGSHIADIVNSKNS